VLSREATIYHTRGEHANLNTTDAVLIFFLEIWSLTIWYTINYQYQYSLICFQWSSSRQRKNDSIRQLITYFRLVNPDCQFKSETICILILLEGNLCKHGGRFALRCFCNNLWSINYIMILNSLIGIIMHREHLKSQLPMIFKKSRMRSDQ
jgi:hypothetical protein